MTTKEIFDETVLRTMEKDINDMVFNLQFGESVKEYCERLQKDFNDLFLDKALHKQHDKIAQILGVPRRYLFP